MKNESRQGPSHSWSGKDRRAPANVGQGLLLALVGLLVTLVVMELLVRAGVYVTGRAPNSDERTRAMLRRSWPALAVSYPDRIYELKPRGHQVFHGEEFVTELIINSQRLRDREHSSRKPAGTYRILALGDSFTFGWGVEVGDTWWAELGRLMVRQMSPVSVEVINLGVYNYTFDQQVQRLQEFGLAYEPDIIVTGFYYPHAVTIATHMYANQRSKPWPRILESNLYVDSEGLLRFGRPAPFEALRQHSALADLVLVKVKRIQYSYGRSGRLNDFGLLEVDRQGEFRHAWDLTRDAHERLMQLANLHRIPVVVFEIPRDIQVWPRWKKVGVALPRTADLHSRLPQETFAKICQDLRMECIDLLPRFIAEASQRPGAPLYYAVDPHWTAAGHRLAAKVVFDYLVAHETDREERH